MLYMFLPLCDCLTDVDMFLSETSTYSDMENFQ